MTENEDRLLEALRRTFAGRAELAELKSDMQEKLRGWLDSFSKEFRSAIDHLKEGNGSPGLHPLSRKIDAHIAESTRRFDAQGVILTDLSKVRGKWSKLRWAVATSVITGVSLMAIQWAMVNQVTAPVAQKAETDQAEVAGLKKMVGDLNGKIDALMKQQQSSVPAVSRSRGRQQTQQTRHRPEPIGALKTGDIVDGRPTFTVDSALDEKRRP